VMPTDDRGGLDHEDPRFPTVPDRGEPSPDKPVGGRQFRALTERCRTQT
jgi:hypothetical protein